MSNVITVKRATAYKIRRNNRGAIIRIDNRAADVLESLLDQAYGQLTVKELASALIEYAANDTIIKWEDEDGNADEE